jgi:hypothetical protein
MTTEQRDELVRDLQRAGVRVIETKQRVYDGQWQVTCWWESPAYPYAVYQYTITNAVRFRRAVPDWLMPVVPRGVLDAQGKQGDRAR